MTTLQPKARLRLRVDGTAVIDDDGRVYRVDEAIERLPWHSALPGGGMPPHQYAVLGEGDATLWFVVAAAIRESPAAYAGYYRGYQTPNRYLEVNDLRYWRTSAGKTHMLNRCRLDSVELPRRVDQGAKALPWQGPPWALFGSPWPPGYVEVSPGRHVYDQSRDSRRHHPCASCGKRYWLASPERPCPRCGAMP